jgi:protein-S-isoprenylcysteine O-methyltransferase Ste14
VLLLLTLAYAYRIRAEEQMLVQAFGTTYAQYQARTSRLLPFVL